MNENFWRATVETENYTFTVFAKTQTEAKNLLRDAWRMHQARTGAWMTTEEFLTDINFTLTGIGGLIIE